MRGAAYMLQILLKAFKQYRGIHFRRNIKNVIVAFGILPFSLVMLFIYFFVSANQWNKVVGETETSCRRMADAINLELSNAIQFSSAFTLNANVISGLCTDYSEKPNKNMDFYQTLNLYLANYTTAVYSNETQIIIFHNNETLFRSKYTRPLSEIGSEMFINKVFQLRYGELYWETDEKNNISLYRKFENMGTYQSVLKFTITNAKIDYIISNTNIQSAEQANENSISYGINLSSSDAQRYFVVEYKLIDGSQFQALIPMTLKRELYIKNFVAVCLILVFFSLLIISLARLLSKNMTKKITHFMQTLQNQSV